MKLSISSIVQSMPLSSFKTFLLPKKNSIPMKQSLSIPPSFQPLAATLLLFVSVELCILEVS